MRKQSGSFFGSFVTQNRILLLADFCVLSYVCGTKLAEFRGAGIDAFGFALGCMIDQYYILYGMLPVVFLLITRYIKNTRDIEVIRYRNIYRHIRQATKQFASWIAAYLLAHLILILTVGLICFPVSTDRKIVELTLRVDLITLLNAYVSVFGSATLAALAETGYMLFGVTVLISLLLYLNHRLGYRKMMFAATAIYLLTFVGFKMDLGTIIPVVYFNKYIILHHALFNADGVRLARFTLLFLCGVLILLLCFGVRPWGKRTTVDVFFITKKETAIAAAVPAVFVLLQLLRSFSAAGFSLKNALASAFFGTSGQSSNFTSWLGLTILYLTPVFLVGISDSRLKQYGQIPLLTRYRNRLDFERNVEKRYLKLLLKYLLAMAIIGNALLLIPSASAEESDFLLELYGRKLSHGLLNLYFAAFGVYLLFDYVLFRSLGSYTGTIAALVFVLAGKFALFLLPAINKPLFTFGLSNLYENIENKNGLLLRAGGLFGIVLVYYSKLYFRRWRYGNH